MDILGITIPTWATAVGAVIGAFLVGFGAGFGSETAKDLYIHIFKPTTAKLGTINNNVKEKIENTIQKEVDKTHQKIQLTNKEKQWAKHIATLMITIIIGGIIIMIIGWNK